MDFIGILGKNGYWKKIEAKTMENLFCFQGSESKGFWTTIDGKELFEELYFLTQSGFQREASAALRDDTQNHVYSSESLYVAVSSNKISGYVVTKMLENGAIGSILYLSGVIISPASQGNHFGGELIKAIISQHNPRFVTLRTQSPIMYECFSKVCGNVYPCHKDNGPSQAKIAADFTAKNLNMANYNPALAIEKGTYGSSLYGIEPVSKNVAIETWFKERINLKKGDSMILAGIPLRCE
jgi:hypothetical protein